MVTVWLWSGPSVVANDQLQVPLAAPLLVMAPIDAEIVTLLLPTLENVPVFVAVLPSLTATAL